MLERALQTHAESSIFSICSQLIELISPPDEAFSGGGKDSSGSGSGSGSGASYDSVFGILSRRAIFSGITELLGDDDKASG